VRRARGFTLLEVLVALTVTATALVILQRAGADALRARRSLVSDVERRGALRATLVHLLGEAGGAVPGTLRIARTPGGNDPTLEFAVEEPVPLLVRYRLAARRLERVVVPRFAVGDASEPATVLLPDVAAVDFRGSDGDGWHDTWEQSRSPALLALDLELVSGERLATIVPLVARGHP
jgi:prepilin-type N-terminal cleavage/methylation domain-containing protein